MKYIQIAIGLLLILFAITVLTSAEADVLPEDKKCFTDSELMKVSQDIEAYAGQWYLRGQQDGQAATVDTIVDFCVQGAEYVRLIDSFGKEQRLYCEKQKF